MMRFKAGEEEAFEQLVRRNIRKVHALAYRFLGDSSQVEDVAQEVFLRVYRGAARYQPAAKFSTWLYRIVANLSFNAMRSRRKGYLRQIAAMPGEDGETFFREVPDDRDHSPDRRLHAGELREKIAAAIDRLPGNQKVAMILNKYEGKSYEEISVILACSPMAVKSLLSRARRSLREALSGYLADR